MNNLSSLVAASLSAALLAACGGLSQIAPSDSAQLNAFHLNTQSVGRASTLIIQSGRVPIHTDHRKSWMSPEAKNGKLLYISDVGTNDVNVYSYPAGELVGQLSGFNEPQGECVDDTNNVYITNTLDSNIVEYAHGGTQPIATLNDPGQYPVDCVYDQGAIALANITSTTNAPGSVSFYFNGAIQGTWVDPNLSRIYHIGHVGKSRGVPFFIDGLSATTGKFEYAKLSDGRFTEVALKANIVSPGAIEWWGENKFMAVGDETGSIYKTKGPTVFATTTLAGVCQVGQYTITKSKLLVPDPCKGDVAIYVFPAAGSPIKVIRKDLTKPVGSALSL